MAGSPLAVGGKVFGRFLGNTVSAAAGFSAGAAIGPVLGPAVQALRNTVNSQYAYVFPDPVTLAAGVAQGQVAEKTARLYASYHGFGDDAMTALIDVANTGPALGQAYSAWRRGDLTDGQFTTALKRTGLEPQWFPAMLALKDVYLEPAEIAKAIHRGIMKGDGLLIASPPTTPGNVKAVPPSDIDPIAEAEAAGTNAERLRVMVGNAGLPLGLHEMLGLLNRGIMTADDVQRGIAESNLRNEYQDVALELKRRLLTPHEYEELALRGILTNDQADAGAALSGMEAADAQLLFEVMGRPLVVHQITTGLARGGAYGGSYDDVPEPYRDAIRRSSVRPEYAGLAYANRYTLPGYFVIKAMLTNGSLTTAEAADIFKQSGWPPDLADKAAAALSSGGTKTKTLTPAQIRAGHASGAITETDALARLEAAGYSAADAGLYLNLPARASSA